jgi:hypothetical protein
MESVGNVQYQPRPKVVGCIPKFGDGDSDLHAGEWQRCIRQASQNA